VHFNAFLRFIGLSTKSTLSLVLGGSCYEATLQTLAGFVAIEKQAVVTTVLIHMLKLARVDERRCTLSRRSQTLQRCRLAPVHARRVLASLAFLGTGGVRVTVGQQQWLHRCSAGNCVGSPNCCCRKKISPVLAPFKDQNTACVWSLP